MNMVEKQVLAQFMSSRRGALQNLLNFAIGEDKIKLQGQLEELTRWESEIKLGNYDAKVW